MRPTPLPVLLLLLSILLSTPACTTLPATEFHTYRAAFAQSRTAGEAILLDWAAADARFKAIEAAETPPADDSPAAALAVWSPDEAAARLRPIDHVGARLEAWRITAEFNDALLALAEGRKAETLRASIDALTHNLATFPWEQLGDDALKIVEAVSGPIAPAVAALRVAAAEAQREADRRRFLAAINAAAPLVRGLVAMLKAETTDFWNVRYGLYDREHFAAIDRLGVSMTAIKSLCQIHGDPRINLPPPSADPAATRQRSAAALLTDFEPKARTLARYRRAGLGEIKPPAAPEPWSESALNTLRIATADGAALITQMHALDHEIRAYRAALNAYVELLVRTDEAVAALAAAADSPRQSLPPARDITAAVLLLRRTLAQYEKAR